MEQNSLCQLNPPRHFPPQILEIFEINKIYDASVLATIQIAIPPPIKEITIKTLRHRKGFVKIYQIGIPIKIHQIFGKNLNTSGEQDLAG